MFSIKNSALKIYITTILLLSLAVASSNLSAQDSDSLNYYRGYIISTPNKTPISFAHVINYTKKWGVVSDSLGYFELWGTSGDTLNVSAIGFQYHDNYVLGQTSDTLIIIELQHRAYEIPEASISYLGTYQQFEQKVIHLDLPKIEFNPQVEGLFKHVERAPLVAIPEISSPASLFYVLFSKEVKETRKYLDLKEESKIKEQVYKKFNEHIVRNITGLSLLESKKFIEYCDFHDKYIINTPKYNIYSRVLEKFKEYKKSNLDSLIIE